MAKGKDRKVGPAAELFPPEAEDIDTEFLPLSPALAKLRYDLLVRRGEAWGVGPWVPPRINLN